MKRLLIALAALPIVLLAVSPACAAPAEPAAVHKTSLSAHKAFEDGMGAWDVKFDAAKGAVVLYDHVLIEDDGPGISANARWMVTDKSPLIDINEAQRLKKILRVERPGALEARLYAPRGVSIAVNGRAIGVSRSEFPQVPVDALKAGDNEIVLYVENGKGTNVKMATMEHVLLNAPDRRNWPRRSFSSADGGKTWQPAAGEYMVRLHLVQYAEQGHFISPVIDLGKAPDEAGLLLTPVSVQSVKLTPDFDAPEGTGVRLELRTGTTPVHDEAHWTDWQAADRAVPPASRYLQWKATLLSADPLKTPALKSVAVAATVVEQERPAWAAELAVKDSRNERIRYTSFPFQYEDPLSPKMVALREKYKIDEVIAGAKTEMEQMAKLRVWVSRQWRHKGAAENYPAWDADEIMTRKIGMCVQYSIVFMQCSISLGRQARFVFGNHSGAVDGSGHEVCEWWSNDYGKWVFFDVNQKWHHLDKATGAPLSMLEVHDLILKHYYPGEGVARWQDRPREAKYSNETVTCYGDSAVPNAPPERKAWHMKDGLYRVPSRWFYMRYMPRNNFLSQPRPVPICQGFHWDYPDFYCWQDDRMPMQWLYRNFTARRSDVLWTINQVHFDAALADQPGTVNVQMGTFTPYLDAFLVKVDDGDWKPSGKDFAWRLHAGKNRLSMRVRNTSGVTGVISFIELEN